MPSLLFHCFSSAVLAQILCGWLVCWTACLTAHWSALGQPRFVHFNKHARGQHAGQPQALHTQPLAESLLCTQDLVSRGCIEYVDCEEEETTMIAMEIKDLDRATDGHIAYSNTCAHYRRPFPSIQLAQSCLVTVELDVLRSPSTCWLHSRIIADLGACRRCNRES